MSDSTGRERVLWPRGRKTAETRAVAPRVATLDDKTIGEVWDDLFRGDEIFPMLREELGRRYRNVKFVDYKTFGSTHGAAEHKTIAEMPDRLRTLGVDAVISGMAC